MEEPGVWEGTRPRATLTYVPRRYVTVQDASTVLALPMEQLEAIPLARDESPGPCAGTLPWRVVHRDTVRVPFPLRGSRCVVDRRVGLGGVALDAHVQHGGPLGVKEADTDDGSHHGTDHDDPSPEHYPRRARHGGTNRFDEPTKGTSPANASPARKRPADLPEGDSSPQGA